MKVDEQLEIIKAYKEGKRIGYRLALAFQPPNSSICSTYSDIYTELKYDIYTELKYKDDYHFDFVANIYKIMEPKTTRPYKDAEELKQAMLEHGNYFINKKHRDCFKVFPIGISDDGVMLAWNNKNGVKLTQYTYKDLFNFWLHEDGAVCGIVKGE